MKVLDQLFKWATLVVLCGYLYTLRTYVTNNADQGRYSLLQELILLDTKRGAIYWADTRANTTDPTPAWIEFHPPTGGLIRHVMREDDVRTQPITREEIEKVRKR